MGNVDEKGFRKDVKPFFTQFTLSVLPDQKQVSPFIVNDGKSTKKCSTLDELLKYDDDVEVLQTWPGTKRSDVFYFKVGEIREHLKGIQKGG